MYSSLSSLQLIKFINYLILGKILRIYHWRLFFKYNGFSFHIFSNKRSLIIECNDNNIISWQIFNAAKQTMVKKKQTINNSYQHLQHSTLMYGNMSFSFDDYNACRNS